MREFAKAYHELITGEFKGLNLTRILDFEEFYQKQILDSLYPAEQSAFFEKDILSSAGFIDVGFGGGFPLLPLAQKYPQQKFLGIEARGKKAKAVGEIAQKLGLKNVKTAHYRLEDLFIDQNYIVSFKAVGPMDRCLKWLKSNHHLKVYFYKGPSVEKDEFPALSSLKSWEMKSNEVIEVPGTNKRSLIGMMLGNVPRGTEINLAKVSEFF